MEMIHEGAQIARLEAARVSATDKSASEEYLTFRLGAEEYGIDILRVQEIRSYEPPTRLANAPAFIKGVVNLRGVIVPVVDLRIKFGCKAAHYDGSAVVVVLNIHHRIVGVVVDSVSDVVALSREAILAVPAINNRVAPSFFITGVGSMAERMLILLDIQALMSSEEMGLSDNAAAH